jgi:glycosyltransferase involved in cell wall biosynthesis
VALCTHNGAQYLREQLDSIAAQIRPPDELVVCDDCSTDETVGILKTFASTSRFAVRVYRNQENLGSSKNFEKAITLCAGDVIALSDQDDVWRPDKLRHLEETFLEKPNVGMVFSDLEIVDENLQPLGYRAWQSVCLSPRRRRVVSKHSPLNILLKHNVVTGCALAFRAKWRDVILPIPDLGDGVLHDYWIALLMGALSAVVVIETPLVSYRQHSNQQLGLPPPAHMSEPQRLIRWLRKRLELEPILLEAVRTRLSSVSESECYKNLIRDIEKRQAHIQRRVKTKELRFVGRSLYSLRELLTLRYFRYSEGWVDALRDVMPATVARLCLFVASRQWFHRISNYLDPTMTENRLGISIENRNHETPMAHWSGKPVTTEMQLLEKSPPPHVVTSAASLAVGVGPHE